MQKLRYTRFYSQARYTTQSRQLSLPHAHEGSRLAQARAHSAEPIYWIVDWLDYYTHGKHTEDNTVHYLYLWYGSWKQRKKYSRRPEVDCRV